MLKIKVMFHYLKLYPLEKVSTSLFYLVICLGDVLCLCNVKIGYTVTLEILNLSFSLMQIIQLPFYCLIIKLSYLIFSMY